MRTITETYDKFIDKIGMPEECLDALLQEDKWQKITSFLVAFFGGLLLYSPIILKWLPHHDGIYYGIYYRGLSEYALENGSGRFGNTFLAHLKGMFIFPAMDVILSIIFLALAIALVLDYFEIKDIWANCILSLLLVASPCYCATITYYYCTDSYFLGILFSVLAFLFMSKEKNIWRFLVSASFIGIALSIYQAYIFVTAALCLMNIIILLIKNKKKWISIIKDMVWYILCAIFGGVIFSVSFLYIQKIWNVSAFSAHVFDASKKITGNEILTQSLQPYKDFFDYYLGERFIYNGGLRVLLNIIIFLTIYGVLIKYIKEKQNDTCKKVLLLICTLILPFAFQGVSVLSSRTAVYILMFPTVGFLYVLSFVLFDNISSEKNYIFVKRILYTALTILCFTLLLEAYQYQKTRDMNISKMHDTAVEIAKHIENVVDYSNYPIMVVGEASGSEMVYSGTFAGTIGWLNYMRQYMGLNYNMSSDNTMKYIVETNAFKEMPVFPEDGFVDVIENNVVVKLSEPD